MHALDHDGDRALSTFCHQIFKKFDADGDVFLSHDEYVDYLVNIAHAADEEEAMELPENEVKQPYYDGGVSRSGLEMLYSKYRLVSGARDWLVINQGKRQAIPTSTEGEEADDLAPKGDDFDM